MTTWTCVRCSATVEPYRDEPDLDREDVELGDLLPELTEEAESWVTASDQAGGWLCGDCATPAERWRHDGCCVRCGADEPRGWDEQRAGEWLRVSEDGGVCPDCWVPADADAEVAALQNLAPIIGEFGLLWDERTVERARESQDRAAKLRGADGPESLLDGEEEQR
jgi:hypothetical protein